MTEQDVFGTCTSADLRVDHDVKMLVRLKPSVKREKQDVQPDPPRFGSGVQPSEGEQAAEFANLLEVREPDENMENIHIRVLCAGAGSDADLEPDRIKIELTSDNDIFFHYVCM